MSRTRALVAIAVQQLRYRYDWSLLATIGIAVAVLLGIALSGLAIGLFTTGGEALGWINRDLWVTGGQIGFAPGTVGGIDNPIQNAHPLAADLERRPTVTAAQPFTFLTVYISANQSSFETTIGVGSTGSQGPSAAAGDIELNDAHYANGTYDGPMTHEIIIDPRTSEKYDVGVNDTLYVGGTLAAARNNEFRITAISKRYSTFLGTSAVAMPLSELQEVTATTGTDPASFIALALTADAAPERVATAIEREYPTLTVRTNTEQVQRIIGQQASVLVGIVAIALLSVFAGAVLVLNVVATIVTSQRSAFAAAQAAGMSRRSLRTVVTAQGTLIGFAGGLVGVVISPAVLIPLNMGVEAISGFAMLVTTPWWLYGAALLIATSVGTLGGFVAGWWQFKSPLIPRLES
ncbi:FtsX-like permease family protein [Halosegnis longus]|uniref:FtsX-like permease family protein n=1 Tax=Halosegnis longus TaxID=2216012 RepID=UPI0009AE20CC|nr:ABC transporter permease [Salella cibi]